MFDIIITGALDKVALDILGNEKDMRYDYRPDIPRGELLKIIPNYNAIISRSETDVDAELINLGKKLGVIARAGVGFGNIDVKHASTKGILVFNTPNVNTNSAAELTVGLLLACYRNIVPAHVSTSGGSWNRHEFTGRELAGKTVGIIGLGNVGHRVARFLRGFDCRLIAFDPYVTEDYCNRHHCGQVSFDELCKTSDIITVHTPKNEFTKNIIGQPEFERMRTGVVIINAARGGIVNEAALAIHLDNGKVSVAGIDTFDAEPLPRNHPLLNHPKTILTPHIGASTVEAQYKIAVSVAQETLLGLRGGIVNNPLNLPKMVQIDNNLTQKYSILAERLGKLSAQYLDPTFHPMKFEFLFRGGLEKKDAGIVKLTFMKGFLSQHSNQPISYVNAMSIAEEKGFQMEEGDDRSFSDYETAIRIVVRSANEAFYIGGTVLGKEKIRLTYFQKLAFEVELNGNLVIVENEDTPGAIGHIGTVIGAHNININRLYLARHGKDGGAIAMVLIDGAFSQDAENSLLRIPCVKKVNYITMN